MFLSIGMMGELVLMEVDAKKFLTI